MASGYSIDTGNSFNDNCVICCPMDDGVGAGEIENIVDSSTISMITGVSNGTDHIIFDGTTGLLTGLTVACRGAFTALIEFEVDSIDQDNGLWGCDNVTSPDCQFWVDNNAGGDRLDAYFAGHTLGTDGEVSAVDTRYTAAITSDGNDIIVYLNGSDSTASGGTNGSFSSDCNENLGSTDTQTSKPLYGRIYHFRRFTRELSPSEISTWHSNRLYGLLSGGGNKLSGSMSLLGIGF